MAGNFLWRTRVAGFCEVEWFRRGRVEGGVGEREGWNGVGEL